MADYLQLAKDAFEASSAYIDTNWRKDWEYGIRAFRNEHAPGSKYLSEEYKSRSRLFPPHTRTIIRKNEAAAMQAAFSNKEMAVVEPGNPDDIMSVAAAAALKEVINYRLSRTLPTYQIYLGGVQDAQTTGTVCSYQYWEYERTPEGKKLKDKPCIELRPIENIRLDGGASWLDPVNTSPYFCDIIPMYVCDVKSMMKNIDDKTGKPKWKTFPDSVILKARPDVLDTTRKARLGEMQDPQNEESGIKSFDIVWVMRWFMRDGGEDRTFYTLGTEELLCDAVPIDEVYFHGVRPYVLGYSILETHKTLKSGLPVLTRPLQQESAEITNQRIDNVKFVLNKRWIVARGRQVDVNSLVRNVPGGVTLTTDPNNDIKESNWPDVTSSAFVEQDRLKSAFDELAGNFSPSTKVANNAVNDTLGGSRLAAAGAGLMSEYLIRTINETWWEGVLRQLALLIQHYETDEVILGICANKAQLFPRFGISKITDMLLMNEVTVGVDMAMGEPTARMQKFLMATNAAIQIVGTAPPGANVPEMIKEIYANAGYRDGSRFFSEQQDPRLMKAMQMVQQLQSALQGKQMELQQQGQLEQMKIQSNEKIKGAEIQVNAGRINGDIQIRKSELLIEQQKLELEKIKLQLDSDKSNKELMLKISQMEADIEVEKRKLDAEKQRIELENSRDNNAMVNEINKQIALHDVKVNSMIEIERVKQEHAKQKQMQMDKESSDQEDASHVEEMSKQNAMVMGTLAEIVKSLSEPKQKTMKAVKNDDGSIVINSMTSQDA